MMAQPKLPLTDSEKKALRKYKIRIRDIYSIETIPLCSILSCFEQRAKRLKALAEFQTIPSIVHKFAQNLVRLSFYSIDDFKGKDPVELFRDLENYHGTSIDPCVEDQFRQVVHYAHHPNSEKQWWDMTEERKRERSRRKN